MQKFYKKNVDRISKNRGILRRAWEVNCEGYLYETIL